MTKHIVKVGDKFQLGKWAWEVVKVDERATFSWFRGADTSTQEHSGSDEYYKQIDLPLSDADSLDWLAPEIKKLTKEQAEMIKHKGSVPPPINVSYFAVTEAWLDSITE